MPSNTLVFSTQENTPVFVWKALGERWYVAIVSRATKDRVGELVTKSGMDFAIDVAKEFDYHSFLYIEHAVPYTKIGKSVREMRIGNSWVEIGKFFKNELADMAYKALEKSEAKKIRLSIGFLTPVSQRKKGVYTKLIKFDTSLVLRPAHPDTSIIVGGGNNKMNKLMDQVLDLLGPENEEEEKKAMAMLKKLFPNAKSMDGGLTFVGKAGEDGDEKDKKKKPDFSAFMKKAKAEDEKVYDMLEKMAEAMPDNEDVKKVYAAMKAKMDSYPDMEEEEEEEEDMPAKKSKSEGVQTLLTAVAEIVDERLEPISEQIAGLSDMTAQVGTLTERVKNLESDTQAAEVIAALVKRLPDFGATKKRPSKEAPSVPSKETGELIEELQKRLDDGGGSAAHPLAHFIGGSE